jgi:hypothetical protein
LIGTSAPLTRSLLILNASALTRTRDEDAEGELIPRIQILSVLCEHCRAVLKKNLDIAAWEAQYLAMYVDQIDEMEPTDDYKHQRRVIIEATFDKVIKTHQDQWGRSEA